jgi:hypothetical protein
LNLFLKIYRLRVLGIIFLLYCIGSQQLQAQNESKFILVEGKITDSVTLMPIAGVTVVHLQSKKAVVSDANGYYRLKLPAGINIVMFRYIGYVTKQIEINSSSNLNLKVALKPDVQQISEVSITARGGQQKVEDVNTGTFQLNRKEIASIPVLLGETDFFRAIQLMPGIQTTGEGNAAIYVRGGGFDQNLVLLDEATVYNPTHLLGFYSVFNSDAINSVKVIKSGIPAHYGNRLSSVIDFDTKKGIPDHTNIMGNVGLLSARLGIEVPLLDHKMAVSFYARKTYLNTWLALMKATDVILPKSILYKTKYDFYDLNANITAVLNAKNRLSVNFYNGNDLLQLHYGVVDLNADMQWGNKTGSIIWNKIFNDKFYMENSVVFSDYKLDMDLSQSQYNFKLFSEISDYGFKNKFTWLFSNHKVNFGVTSVYHNLAPNTSKASSDSTQLNLGSVNRYYSIESSAFVSDEFAVNKKLSCYLGFRLNSFDHFGNFKEYIYDEAGNVTDTIIYSKGEHIKNYTDMDVRASLRYLLRDNFSMKFSFNSNHQYLHLVSASSITFPTDFWVSSSGKVKPQQGYQWTAGVYHFHKKTNIETSVEVYYKTFTNQIEFYKGIFTAMDNSSFDNNLIFGKGRAWGAEFLIRKTQGKVTGWIGYTLSKTEKSFSEIENGRWFPAKYDRPNDLSVVANYEANKKWSFSAVFVYATGSTYTPVVGRYIMSGNVINEYGQYNSARMPAYHRCDVSATLILKKTETRESKLIFSIYNVYNRRNPFFVYPKATGNIAHYSLNVSPKEISIFPILPSIAWEFRF